MPKNFLLQIAILVGLTALAAIYWQSAKDEKPAAAFMCPETHSKTTSTALQETPEQLAQLTDRLKGPEQENTVHVIASDLKKQFPGAGNADIVNYMLTAYCPLVAAKNGLSSDEKQARMDRFSSQAYQILGAD